MSSSLSEASGGPLANLLLETFISSNFKKMSRNCSSGGPFLIRNDRVKELQQMYFLFSKVQGALAELRDVFKQVMQQQGPELLLSAFLRLFCSFVYCLFYSFVSFVCYLFCSFISFVCVVFVPVSPAGRARRLPASHAAAGSETPLFVRLLVYFSCLFVYFLVYLSFCLFVCCASFYLSVSRCSDAF